MEQKIIDFWKGYVQIKIFGDSCERFLNLCAFHQIRLWNLQIEQGSFTACLTRKDFKRVRTIVRKSHVSVRIKKKRGMPFLLHKYRKRRFYAAGILIAVCSIYWMSSHIWKISIEGNISQTDDVIFEYLMQQGIEHGISKSKLDCKMLADKIRNYFPDFSWTSVELKGTHLIVSVKEGMMQKHALAEETNNAVNLTAEENGIIMSVFVRKGTALVETGDRVKKGDLLVAGFVPIMDDSQTVVSWQETKADADVVIQRKIDYYDKIEYKQQEKDYTGKEKTSYAVRIGDEIYALPLKSIAYERYDLHTVLKQIQLGNYFYLPIYVQKFTAKEYENKEIIYTKEQSAEFLKMNFQYFMKNLEKKGVQIFENDVKIEWNEKSAIAEGTILIGESAVKQTAATEWTKEELLKHEYD